MPQTSQVVISEAKKWLVQASLKLLSGTDLSYFGDKCVCYKVDDKRHYLLDSEPPIVLDRFLKYLMAYYPDKYSELSHIMTGGYIHRVSKPAERFDLLITSSMNLKEMFTPYAAINPGSLYGIRRGNNSERGNVKYDQIDSPILLTKAEIDKAIEFIKANLILDKNLNTIFLDQVKQVIDKIRSEVIDWWDTGKSLDFQQDYSAIDPMAKDLFLKLLDIDLPRSLKSLIQSKLRLSETQMCH